MNMLLAFTAGILANKVAELIRLSTLSLLLVLFFTLFLCSLGLVEYEHYQDTQDFKQSLLVGTARWFLNRAKTFYVSREPAHEKREYRATRLVEVFCIFILATGMLLALCLISYDPHDTVRQWDQWDRGEVRNWVGEIGAFVADLLFRRMGNWAFLLPALLFVFSWLLFTGKIRIRRRWSH